MPTPTAPKCPFELPARVVEIPNTRAPARFSLADAAGYCVAEKLTGDEATYIAHAINTHAALTAEVARLREALSKVDTAASVHFDAGAVTSVEALEACASIAHAALAANQEQA